jgi:hypothetical protein
MTLSLTGEAALSLVEGTSRRHSCGLRGPGTARDLSSLLKGRRWYKRRT